MHYGNLSMTVPVKAGFLFTPGPALGLAPVPELLLSLLPLVFRTDVALDATLFSAATPLLADTASPLRRLDDSDSCTKFNASAADDDGAGIDGDEDGGLWSAGPDGERNPFFQPPGDAAGSAFS
jgi:hypothetical protein